MIGQQRRTGAIAPFVHHRLCIKWKSTAAKASPSPKPSKKYTTTILLPKTSYPQRIKDGSARMEADQHVRLTSRMDELYAWQRDAHRSKPEFILHDGPPYANGNVHVGHAVNKILKDITNRYKILKGYRVDYRPGWDCHGLPIELKALEKLGVQQDTTDKIRKAARSIVDECSVRQRNSFASWGVCANWKNDVYFTADKKYEAKQIELFWRLYDADLIYRELKPVYWSPSSQTSLAEAELEYNEKHESTAAFVAVPIVKKSNYLKVMSMIAGVDMNMEWLAVIWTTTPWTLPANQAIAFNPELSYAMVIANFLGEECAFLLAEQLIEKFQQETGLTVRKGPVFSGNDLATMTYQQPVDPTIECPFVPSGHVALGKGSGLVHIAPVHGHDDYLVGKKHKLDLSTCLVDVNGKFTEDAGDILAGKNALTDGNATVLDFLNTNGSLLKQETIVHSYPYDWRTKKPVILRASEQWFIDVEKIRPKALETLQKVEFLPPNGRQIMMNQLESRPYWCISRQRSWGVPIPVFYTVDGRPLINEQSASHISALIGQNGSDVWWEETDEVLLPGHIRKTMQVEEGHAVRRGTDIMDIWLEAGTSWAAALGEEKVADLYLEGHDQYSAWFQTSLLTSVALRNIAPFKKVFVHGFALDENGRKMSKSLGNVVEPTSITDQHGVDILRWWVAQYGTGSTNITIGHKIIESVKENLLKIRNTIRFVLGNLSDYQADSRKFPIDGPLLLVDQYMLLLVKEFVQKVDSLYTKMEYNKVAMEISSFVNSETSSFYLTSIKDRMYCEPQDSLQRRSAQFVLSELLNAVSLSAGPIVPHMVEESFQHANPSSEMFSFFQKQWREPEVTTWQTNLKENFGALLEIRDEVNKACASQNMLQLELNLRVEDAQLSGFLEDLGRSEHAAVGCSQLVDLFGVSQLKLQKARPDARDENQKVAQSSSEVSLNSKKIPYSFWLQRCDDGQCERCRKYNVKTNGRDICERCLDVIGNDWSK